MSIILASQSPRRIELMKFITTDFTCQTAPIDEKTLTDKLLAKNTPPEKLVQRLAHEKALAVHEHHPNKTIIGADTIVYSPSLGILGKPSDAQAAEAMLTKLSQTTTHTVYTGVSIIQPSHTSTFTTQADVHFQPFDDLQKKLIQDYVASGSPMDKAGGYSIGDQGALLIDTIEGDYYTILGFPLAKIIRKIE